MQQVERSSIEELSKKKKAFLNIAKQLATLSTYGHYRHGAVLVNGGKIMSSSYNKNRFNAFGYRFRKHGTGIATMHAELGCVFGMPRNITEGSTIYVVRLGQLDDLRMSKPCDMCHGILEHCGVKKVVYSLDNEFVESYRF